MISVRAALGAAQDYGVAGFGRSRVPPVHGAARTKTPLVRAALGAAQDYGMAGFGRSRVPPVHGAAPNITLMSN